MTLTRLIYASHARQNLHISELLQIRQQSKSSNAARGISGMLCYGDDAFLQVLEGKRDEVNALYARILRDPRHSDPEILTYSTMRKRDYGEWSMKAISIGDPFAVQRRAVFARHFPDMIFNPLAMAGRTAIALLRDLAGLERVQFAALHAT